jgi:hypothetical protein
MGPSVKRTSPKTRFLLIRFWTFDAASGLVRAATALGFDGMASLKVLSAEERLATAPSLAGLVEAERRFVSAECRSDKCAAIACAALAELRVSPLDPLFPVIDWSKRLAREDHRLRAECASLIISLSLLGLTSDPSTLTLRIELPEADAAADFLAGEILTALPDVLDDTSVRLSGAGYSSSGFYLPLPPETVAYQALQIDLLRTGFEAIYPIMIMHREAAARLGPLSDPWTRVDGRVVSVVFRRDDLGPRPLADLGLQGIRAELLPDAAYRTLQETHGLIEAPGCSILSADRSTHPLAEQALAAMRAIGVELVPLRQGAAPWSTPALLLANEGAAALRSALTGGSSILEAVRSPGVALDDNALAILERLLRERSNRW